MTTPLLARTCEGTRLHRKLMQCNEKLIELIIHWIHCENIWNNDHDNHKNKEVTCTFTSVSGFSQIQHGGFLILFVVIVAFRAIMLIVNKTLSCTCQRQNFESRSLMYFYDC